MAATDDGPEGRIAEWMARLADDSGEVGGGAACAVVVATSAALVEMVGRYADADPAVARAGVVRRAALRAAEDDGAVSAALGGALRSGDDEEIRRAALVSARSAVAVGELAAGMLPDLDALADEAAGYLLPDVVVAIESAAAAVSGTHAIAAADRRLALAHAADHAGVGELDARMRALVAARRRLDELRDSASGRL
ncbi:MAG: hypothetical protein QM626_13860 [Microbacterium sp.]|uniref:cyclodeaminase/cyclohydrolase family protein n=1 Tax=Microbacterium sp. TaxID=51671 RepID=UPI0039E253B6